MSPHGFGDMFDGYSERDTPALPGHSETKDHTRVSNDRAKLLRGVERERTGWLGGGIGVSGLWLHGGRFCCAGGGAGRLGCWGRGGGRCRFRRGALGGERGGLRALVVVVLVGVGDDFEVD